MAVCICSPSAREEKADLWGSRETPSQKTRGEPERQPGNSKCRLFRPRTRLHFPVSAFGLRATGGAGPLLTFLGTDTHTQQKHTLMNTDNAQHSTGWQRLRNAAQGWPLAFTHMYTLMCLLEHSHMYNWILKRKSRTSAKESMRAFVNFVSLEKD